MFRLTPFLVLAANLILNHSDQVAAAEPVTLKNVVDPGANRKDEPIGKWSGEKAIRFLDSASLSWQKERGCFTCHTNYAYLYARPLVGKDAVAHKEVRKFAEKLVTERWPEKEPRWDAEVIATAAALAFNDANTTGDLHATTKTALDRMWTVQTEDGGFDWLKCDWPPFESDDHYGAALAALAVGVAPEDYASSEAAKKGVAGLRKYLRTNPGPAPHHRAMVLWASTELDGLLTEAEQKKTVNELLKLQKEDGGWNTSTLGKWQRQDKSPQDTETSDGYATGFVIYVLRQAGVPADDARIQKGIHWLKSNQRESGRWFTRSQFKDSRHYISHAGSAFAVMALAACEELNGKQ